MDGSPAEDAGLEAGDEDITFQGQDNIAVGGDLIVAVDGKELTREHDLADEISGHSAGENVRADRPARRQAAHDRASSSAAARRVGSVAALVRGFRRFRVICRKWWRSPR